MSTNEHAAVKQSRRRELIVGELLDKSTELFAQKGYEATSLQDIADAVGVSRPSLYHYLRNKEDLLVMLAEQMSHRLANVLAQLRERPDLTPMEKIHDLTALLVRERARFPSHFRILDRTESTLPEPAGTEHLEAKRRIVREMVTIIEEGIEAGQIRLVDPRTAALGLLGMCNWTAWWVRPQDLGNVEAIVDEMVGFADGMLRVPDSDAEPRSLERLLAEIRDRVDRAQMHLQNRSGRPI